MTLTVRLFGPYADAQGERELSVDLPPEPTVSLVLETIESRYPALSPLMPSTRLAVNNRFVPPSHEVREGDELALVGMVGGG
ncbi:MAG: MoaD/ThiS family protein [Phycisphaerales bacterium]|nr:MoaD/ThiS family protein [Phycisphaerales bacterium]